MLGRFCTLSGNSLEPVLCDATLVEMLVVFEAAFSYFFFN